MPVRAKFYVAEVTKRAYTGSNTTVVMQAVSRGDGNAAWASATPSGRLEIQINNPAASDQFKLGEEYYIDFTPTTVHVNPDDGHAFRAGAGPETSYNGPQACGECGYGEDKHQEP